MDKTPCFSWIRHLHSSMELLKSVFLAWNAHFYSFKYMWHGKLLVVDPLLRPVLAPHLEYFWVILPPLVKQTMLFGFTLQMVQRHHGRLSPTKQKKNELHVFMFSLLWFYVLKNSLNVFLPVCLSQRWKHFCSVASSKCLHAFAVFSLAS